MVSRIVANIDGFLCFCFVSRKIILPVYCYHRLLLLVYFVAIDESTKWRIIGDIVGESNVNLDTVVWPGGDIIPVSTGKGSRSIFRVVTAFAPPFVMLGELDEDGQCLRGR